MCRETDKPTVRNPSFVSAAKRQRGVTHSPLCIKLHRPMPIIVQLASGDDWCGFSLSPRPLILSGGWCNEFEEKDRKYALQDRNPNLANLSSLDEPRPK